MIENKMFPFKVLSIKDYAFTINEKNQSRLWHLRHRNLNINGLILLNRRDMVIGLSKIDSIGLCEDCIYEK